jgi:hypothetical protein
MIRLALGTLAADNAHHQFEHLSRHLAKRRIASNILPATGPVSAGGDQGRDFETFRTYLAEKLPFAIGFVALASSDVVVFACTIQKDKLRGKFEDDIKSICTQGTHVDRIYIFATASVTTALRHDLQEWAQEHRVAVEIVDEAALAEWLAEPDLYWIAQEYLPRADLTGWLTLMTRLAERTPYPDARLRAIYEIAAARVQGAAELRPADPLIRRFIDEVQRTDDPARPPAVPPGVRWPRPGRRPAGRRHGRGRQVPSARGSTAGGRPATRRAARVPPGQDQLVPRRHPLRHAAGDGLHHRHLRRARHVPRRQEVRAGHGLPRPRQPRRGERYGFWEDDVPHADPFHGQLAQDG